MIDWFLIFIKKGQKYFTAILEPKKLNDEYKIGTKVDSEYEGKKFNQFIIRVIYIPLKSDNNLDFENSYGCGIVIPISIAGQIARLFQDSNNNPAEDPKQLACNPCNLLLFTKEPKTAVTITSKIVEIPSKDWERCNEIEWKQILDAYEASQGNQSETEKKEENNSEVPF